MRTPFLIALLVATLVSFGCAKKVDSSPAKAQENPSASAAKTQGKPAATPDKAASGKGATASATSASGAQGVTVLQADVCRSMENREPVGADTKFSSNVGRLYFYSKVAITTSEETQLAHVWKYQGKEVATVKLPVHGPQWRTYSSKSIHDSQKGDWSVDLTTADGNVLKSVAFKIE